MNARTGAIAGLILALAAGTAGAQEIHLKTRSIQAGDPTGRGGPAMRQPTVADVHQLVQFDHTPSVEDLDALLAGGAQVVSVVPDNAVVVRSPGAVVAARTGIRTVSRIESADKLSPALLPTSVDTGGTPLIAIVEFHSDVDADRQLAVAQAESITLQRPASLNANHAIVQGSMADLQALASRDEVAYIFPADPDLLTSPDFSGCAGMLTLSGPVAQYANLVHGWNLDQDNVAHLGYVFGSLTTKVPAALVQSEIVRALNEWTKHANVAFQPGVSATAARTIAIRFASGAHGDAYPFDGPAGILAHTFYPVPVNPESIAGDMHLDADENWHAGGDLDIYSVALHEAGHAIGLGHSDKPGDVMYPYYRRGMALSANDIGAAQALYGTPGGTAAPATAAPVSTTAAPSPLRLTLDTVPATTSLAQVTVTGTVSGGTAPLAIQWQTDHGYSGQASISSATGWTASGITLVNGTNTISVTVFDSNHQALTFSTTVNLTPAQSASSGTSTVPVVVSITTPSTSVVTAHSPSLAVAGTAGGGSGVTKVTWQSSDGCSGVATGTSHWIATVPLMVGTNTLIVRAYDSNGANAWAAVIAVRN